MRISLNRPLWATLYALAAALAALATAWLLPLPRIIAGDEDQVASQMPQVRTELMSTKQRFDEASERYHTYIATHDVGAMRESAEQAIAAAKAPTHDSAAVNRVRDATRQIDEFARELEAYAEAS